MSARLKLLPTVPEDYIKQFPELHPVIAQILFNRNIHTQVEVEAFLQPDYSRDQHDPFLFADMKKVVERIIQARDNKENVLVYGDYDADGVCSSVLLYSALKHIGIEQLNIYLPHRDTEGYGLNSPAIEKFAEDNVDLMITVDCAISNAEEVQLATDLGIDVIVTDHHVEPPELPTSAYAIINPQVKACGYPFPMLAGVGVAFKVAQALGRTLELGEAFEKWLLDLVAISTVTDCMPLLDENRTLVKYGLVVLNKTRRMGLQHLIASTHKPGDAVTTGSIAFRIGPWINAAGRVDHANAAVDLLLAEESATAEVFVKKLDDTNRSRQALTQKMFTEAKNQISDQTDNQVVYAYAEEWPLGLVGLVAGKLVSAVGKPAFVLTKNAEAMNAEEISGSGRSVEGVNMISLLQSMPEMFERYGGHAMACGFTLAKGITPEQFHAKFVEAAAPLLATVQPGPVLTIDAELKLTDINWDLVEQLDQLEPFGEKNPRPQFLVRDAVVKDFQAVGATNSHLRFLLTDAEKKVTVKAIAFGFGDRAEKISLGSTLTAICELSINQWNGNREIQLQIIDIQDDANA